jgi:hypothetical protein
MDMHHGVLRIDGWDHLYWEIDFVWKPEPFPLRRHQDGWEIRMQRASWRRFDDEIGSWLDAQWSSFMAN